MADDQTINVSQLLLVIVLGGLALRYFFFSSPPSSRGNSAATSASNLRAREADVERIQQMFPQVARRSIMWDLQRNGGSVTATTERILSGRGLDNPPPTFQPPLPVPVTTSTSSSSSSAAPKATPPDLITRYNLAAKIEAESATQGTQSEETVTSRGGKQAWSANKTERQALLQKRREEMILAARRKMEARVKANADKSTEQIV